MKTLTTIKKIISSALRNTMQLLSIIGAFSLLFFLLSFTKLPFKAYYHLGERISTLTQAPGAIVLYSAAGMPDPNTLMRIYTTTISAKEFPKAKIIIAYPIKSKYDSLSISLLKKEFDQRNIDSTRFMFEPDGINTYQQSKYIYTYLKANNIQQIQIVTSPEHVYRASACFYKLGIQHIGSVAAMEQVIPPETLIDTDIEAIGMHSLNLRYNMWNYMKYEITVMREYIAILYYKLKGWI